MQKHRDLYVFGSEEDFNRIISHIADNCFIDYQKRVAGYWDCLSSADYEEPIYQMLEQWARNEGVLNKDQKFFDYLNSLSSCDDTRSKEISQRYNSLDDIIQYVSVAH